MDERSPLTGGRSYLSSTAPARCAPRPRRCSTGSTSTGCTATTKRMRSASTRSAASRSAPPSPSWSTTTRRTARPAASSSSTPRPTPPSGAGVIRVIATTDASPNVLRHGGKLSRGERFAALGTAGGTVLFTGLSGSGKSTLAAAVEEALVNAAVPPSCSTATTCATAQRRPRVLRPTTAPRTCAGRARWPASSPSPASWRSSRLVCPFEEDRRPSAPSTRGGPPLCGGLRRHPARGV